MLQDDHDWVLGDTQRITERVKIGHQYMTKG
jgi:hypothetical protein